MVRTATMDSVEFSEPMEPVELSKTRQRKQAAVHSDGVCELELRTHKRDEFCHCAISDVWASVA
jgi:hypothetical protein